MKQTILTPSSDHILGCLIEQQQRGNRIVSVTPLLRGNVTVTNYIVIVEEVQE